MAKKYLLDDKKNVFAAGIKAIPEFYSLAEAQGYTVIASGVGIVGVVTMIVGACLLTPVMVAIGAGMAVPITITLGAAFGVGAARQARENKKQEYDAVNIDNKMAQLANEINTTIDKLKTAEAKASKDLNDKKALKEIKIYNKQIDRLNSKLGKLKCRRNRTSEKSVVSRFMDKAESEIERIESNEKRFKEYKAEQDELSQAVAQKIYSVGTLQTAFIDKIKKLREMVINEEGFSKKEFWNEAANCQVMEKILYKVRKEAGKIIDKHDGRKKMIEKAKANCTALIVVPNTDDHMQSLKTH